MTNREQAIRDVAEALRFDEKVLLGMVQVDPVRLCNAGPAMVEAVIQRERVLELEAQAAEQNRVIGNLAMLVRRMARRMQKTSRSWDGDQNLVRGALQYLSDHNLQGSVLRDSRTALQPKGD